MLLIAGGVGITPVMSILRFLTDRVWDGDIYFLIVSRTEQDLIFRDEIRGLKERFPRLHLCETLTRSDENAAWDGKRGRISEALLSRFVPELIRTPVYLCGPNEMMDATCDLLKSLGVPESLIHTEAFSDKKSASLSSTALADDVPAPEEVHQPRSGMLDSKLDGRVATIRFARSNIQSEIDPDTTILEAAEAVSIALPFECRSGICGQCKTRLIDGSVKMDSDDALSSADRAAGLILACQAHALTPVTIDA